MQHIEKKAKEWGTEMEVVAGKFVEASSSYRVHTLDIVFQPELNTAPSNIIVLCRVLSFAFLFQ